MGGMWTRLDTMIAYMIFHSTRDSLVVDCYEQALVLDVVNASNVHMKVVVHIFLCFVFYIYNVYFGTRFWPKKKKKNDEN